jgi:hypothetical protein
MKVGQPLDRSEYDLISALLVAAEVVADQVEKDG